MNINIAVLSDLHIGRGARAKDLCPYDECNATDDDYIPYFIEFIRENKLFANYLIISGDISHEGQPDEFSLASSLINDIAKNLKVPEGNIFLVPGNHDVDWSIISNYPNDKSGLRSKQRYDPIRHEKWIFSKIFKQGNPAIFEYPHLAIWDSADVVVVGYNSSWHDKPNTLVHHGLFFEESKTYLENFLVNNSFDKKLKIFLVHHHPIIYSDPLPNMPDFSAMTNAEHLLHLLKKYKFDILIHGHKHSPRFRTIIDSGFPLAVLCSGSFSGKLDTKWSGLVNNQFHMIRIHGRDEEELCIYGTVESWAYLNGHGWIQSKTNNGIEHKNYFGKYVNKSRLEKHLFPIIENGLERNNFIKVSQIIDEFYPELIYVNQELIMSVLKELSSKLNFELHGESFNKLILLQQCPVRELRKSVHVVL